MHDPVAPASPDDAGPEFGRLLAADVSAAPSHRPEFAAALAAALPGFECRWLSHHEDGVCVGAMPVMLERRGPFRWLHAMPWLLTGAPLAVPGTHERCDAALSRAFAALAARERVVGGEWAFRRAEGPAPEPGVLEALPGETRWIESALLPVGRGTDALLAAMPRKQRQALEHARARGYVFAEEPAALDAAWALHLAQSRAWPGHRPLPLELSRRLLAARPLAGGPVARLFTLRSAHGLASATLVLDSAHEAFAWWSGTHPSERRREASLLLLWSVAEWAAAAGRRRLDLGASTGLAAVAAFKRSLAAEPFRSPVRWIGAAHAAWPGRLLAGVQTWRRRGRARGEAA